MKRIVTCLLILITLALPLQAYAMTITVTQCLDAPEKAIDETDVKTLARIVYWEARGEPEEGQLAVAQVVLNRVASSLFPDTIAGVISQKGQFSPWGCENYFKVSLPDSCIQAASLALDGLGELPADVLFFRSDACPSAWGIATWYTTIGHHHFYSLKR